MLNWIAATLSHTPLFFYKKQTHRRNREWNWIARMQMNNQITIKRDTFIHIYVKNYVLRWSIRLSFRTCQSEWIKMTKTQKKKKKKQKKQLFTHSLLEKKNVYGNDCIMLKSRMIECIHTIAENSNGKERAQERDWSKNDEDDDDDKRGALPITILYTLHKSINQSTCLTFIVIYINLYASANNFPVPSSAHFNIFFCLFV